MSRSAFRRLRPGMTVDGRLTIIDAISRVRGRHPVYIGWDRRNFIPVAAKVCRSLQAAMDEALVLDQVRHPNVVRSLGVIAPDLLLMEVLEGTSLRRMLDDAPLEKLGLSDAIRIALHVGAALRSIHAAGYLYLDLKPENLIMVSGRPILFDFGTARRIDLPRPGGSVGTDAYMAPEEFSLEQAGPAADIFSFGVMLFEMIAGRMPYRDGTPGNPVPQASATPTALRALIPRSSARLENLVARCLSLEPQDRPGWDELLPALNDCILSGPRMWPAGVSPVGIAPSRRSREAA